MSKQKVRATFSHWVTPTVYVREGDLWDADDPVVASHPDWFEVAPEPKRAARPEPPVEQATAAPGEKRTTRRAI